MTAQEYNQVIDRYADNVYRFLLKNLKSEADARDVMQTSFEILWKKKGNVDFAKSKSYLFTVAHSKMIDWIRKQKRTRHQEIPLGIATDSRTYKGLNEIIETALSRLPDIQRSAILLRDYEGYSYKEVGEILNLSESQVKVYIFRARKALRTYLGSLEKVI